MNAANVVIRSEMEPPQIAAFMAALFFMTAMSGIFHCFIEKVNL